MMTENGEIRNVDGWFSEQGPKKDTSAIKVPSLVKANDTLKNMSTTLKSSFSRRKANKDEIFFDGSI